jgi:hypothetical protein
MKELEDKRWRLSNLYSIKDESTGRIIPFKPRPEQQEVNRLLIEEPQVPIFIIKSRRLGMSTNLGLFMADNAVFNAGFKGSLIDQNQADAHRKMADIMRFGVMSLAEPILNTLEFPKKNDGEMTLKVVGAEETSISTIYAGMGARGGTASMLWVSEWGPIAATDPTRSREIRTGALPSARQGIRVVETTWYGGKGGDLWDLIKPILEKDPNAEGRVLFFPWHGDPACVRTQGMVTEETEQYFKELTARLGRTFSQEQKKWYASRKVEQGIFVKREYPSTLDEAMAAPVEGSIYGDIITRLREQGRISPSPVDHSALVHTFWDLGSPENTVTWYVQFVSNDIRVIDVDLGFTGNLIERVSHIMGKGYPLGCHYLPHDAAATKTSGKTLHGELTDAGLVNIKIIPRTHDVWIGINRLQQILPRFHFRLPATERGVEALENYHTKRAIMGEIIHNDPVHDWSSHPADAARMIAEAIMHGMVQGNSFDAAQGRREAYNPFAPNGRGIQVVAGFRG